MKPVKKTPTKQAVKKEVNSARLLEDTRKRIEKLNIKRQTELEKINNKKQQDIEKFQAKKELAYKKKIDNMNNKLDLSVKSLADLEDLLK